MNVKIERRKGRMRACACTYEERDEMVDLGSITDHSRIFTLKGYNAIIIPWRAQLCDFKRKTREEREMKYMLM